MVRGGVLLLCLATTLAFGLSGCKTETAGATSAAAALAPTPQVRVMLDNKTRRAFLIAERPPVLEAGGGRPLQLNLPAEPVSLSLTPAGWQLGDQSFARGELTFTPEVDGSLAVNNKTYRGKLLFRPAGDTEFDVINIVDLESYLAGVLPQELLPNWHGETYKAQAVVARTYAIWEVKTAGPGRGYFDLYDDDRSQVYGGMDSETDKSRAATAATRGEVVVHETSEGWRIFKAYFHSTSGGVTLGNDVAFNEPPIKALSAQSLGNLGQASSRFTWDSVVMSKDEMTRRVKLWGQRRGHPVKAVGKIRRLEIADTNEFGRPTRFEIHDSGGNRYSMLPEEIRWSLNTDRPEGDPTIYSGFFVPINNQHNIVLAEGRGWGHGVGMCQWSAEGLANKGQKHTAIVVGSYPGSRVVRAY